MLRISNFRVQLTDDTPLEQLAARRLKLSTDSIRQVVIIRRAIDARRKHSINFVYTLEVDVKIPPGQVLTRLTGDKDVALTVQAAKDEIVVGNKSLNSRPVVVGAGPAGLFAAYMLAKHGY
ncbi:MAG: hypothetical protein K0R55_4372, partial [Sporomusa sp.]|nr:hypothetical protein [Sporomusa sp.]